jgi:hypothetical protein
LAAVNEIAKKSLRIRWLRGFLGILPDLAGYLTSRIGFAFPDPNQPGASVDDAFRGFREDSRERQR